MDYETLVEIQHNDSGGIHIHTNVSSNNTLRNQLQLCGAREKEAGRVAGSSSSIWSTSVGHHQGEERH